MKFKVGDRIVMDKPDLADWGNKGKLGTVAYIGIDVSVKYPIGVIFDTPSEGFHMTSGDGWLPPEKLDHGTICGEHEISLTNREE